MKKKLVITVCALTVLTVLGIRFEHAAASSEDRTVTEMASHAKKTLNSGVIATEQPSIMVGKPAPDFIL